jgi:hypothetical protein
LPEEAERVRTLLGTAVETGTNIPIIGIVAGPAVEAIIGQTLSNQFVEFEKSMNTAASLAAKGAFNVFEAAVTGMTIQDGFAILNSNDTAAMHYLRETTTPELKTNFSPIVQLAIGNAEVITKYWEPIVEKYNKCNEQLIKFGQAPLGEDINPDLNAYITNKAINGLMTLIGKEEQSIRTNPVAYGEDLLNKVFGKK